MATPDLSFPDAYRQSARRSRARREAAARRRRLLRGGRGGLAILVGALALAAGVAVAQEPAPAPESGDAPAEAIEPGDEGKDVKALQRALKIRPDGEYGRKTKRAVRRFQRKKGLKTDGVAGPETLQALGIAPAGEEDGPTSGDSGGVGSDDHLAQIRECESGGDYTANTGNGFYGAYQFTKESWEQMGGTGMPHEAPPEEQDRLAKKLMEEQGPEAWPNCA